MKAHDLYVAMRRLRAADADAVCRAFASNVDMARQGEVLNQSQAEVYVGRLIAPDSPNEAWAIVDDDDTLVGLVCVTADEANRSGWFWYWMTDALRGRAGWHGLPRQLRTGRSRRGDWNG